MPTRLTKAQAVTVLAQALALLPNAAAYIQAGPNFEDAAGKAVGPNSPDKAKYSLFGAVYVAGQGLTLPRQPPYPPQFITADVTDLLGTGAVSDHRYNAVKDRFGERGVMDLVGAVGYYSMVSMILNVDRVQLPPGVEPFLKPL